MLSFYFASKADAYKLCEKETMRGNTGTQSIGALPVNSSPVEGIDGKEEKIDVVV